MNMDIKNILIINYWRNKGAITVLILKSTFAGNNCNTQGQRSRHVRYFTMESKNYGKIFKLVVTTIRYVYKKLQK